MRAEPALPAARGCGAGQEIGARFRGWGPKLQASAVAVIGINLLAGPLLCKFALRAAGEAGAAGDEAETDGDVTGSGSECGGDGVYGELDSDFGDAAGERCA